MTKTETWFRFRRLTRPDCALAANHAASIIDHDRVGRETGAG
jgi:hypothetical protein